MPGAAPQPSPRAATWCSTSRRDVSRGSNVVLHIATPMFPGKHSTALKAERAFLWDAVSAREALLGGARFLQDQDPPVTF